MAYQLSRDDGSMQRFVRRIALEQIDTMVRAIDASSAASGDVDSAIHELRKSCKKVRGLLRLVRPLFAPYATENAVFRDLAGSVSAVRDAAVLTDTYDTVVERYHAQVDRGALASIRHELTNRRRHLIATRDPAGLLEQCRTALTMAVERVEQWPLQAEGFEAVRGGLVATYRRARKAMRAAEKTPSPAQFHAWRKLCKWHGYHARLLQPIWPGPMRAYGRCAHALTDVLGEQHDLNVLLQTVTDRPGDFGRPADVEVMAGLIRGRQAALAGRALALGKPLLADSPKAIASAWGIRYTAWCAQQAARPATLKRAQAGIGE